MTVDANEMTQPASDHTVARIVGRSSSHFTRVVRLFAAECAVPCSFEVVRDLTTRDADVYGGNPGLRLPNLVTAEGTAFGALNSCRALHRLSTSAAHVVWPEDVPLGVPANAQELTLQAMATEVTLIMSRSSTSEPSSYAAKLNEALLNTLVWLESNLDGALGALPARTVSYFEVALFCLLEHVEFRQLASLTSHPHLVAFRTYYSQRPSAIATPFRFDP